MLYNLIVNNNCTIFFILKKSISTEYRYKILIDNFFQITDTNSIQTLIVSLTSQGLYKHNQIRGEPTFVKQNFNSDKLLTYCQIKCDRMCDSIDFVTILSAWMFILTESQDDICFIS